MRWLVITPVTLILTAVAGAQWIMLEAAPRALTAIERGNALERCGARLRDGHYLFLGNIESFGGSSQ